MQEEIRGIQGPEKEYRIPDPFAPARPGAASPELAELRLSRKTKLELHLGLLWKLPKGGNRLVLPPFLSDFRASMLRSLQGTEAAFDHTVRPRRPVVFDLGYEVDGEPNWTSEELGGLLTQAVIRARKDSGSVLFRITVDDEDSLSSMAEILGSTAALRFHYTEPIPGTTEDPEEDPDEDPDDDEDIADLPPDP